MYYRDMQDVCARADALETRAARRLRELAEAKAVAGGEDELANAPLIDGETGEEI